MTILRTRERAKAKIKGRKAKVREKASDESSRAMHKASHANILQKGRKAQFWTSTMSCQKEIATDGQDT